VFEVDIDRVGAARRRNHRDVRRAQLADPMHSTSSSAFSICLARFSPNCVGIAFLRGILWLVARWGLHKGI
jgi:hypothetical protein